MCDFGLDEIDTETIPIEDWDTDTLLCTYESLLEEKTKKEKSFLNNQEKVDKLEEVYNEVFKRLMAYNG